MKFDVIMPVGEKDVSFIPRVVDHLSRCLKDMEHIYILTAKQHFKSISTCIRGGKKTCVLIDENKLVPGLTFTAVRRKLAERCPKKLSTTGWYFQQFLKLAFAQSQYCKEYYLSWDADTLALAPIQFFEGEHILFNPKHEYNPNYFKTISRLLGYGKQNDFSYIAENMMFSKKIVCEMLVAIEQDGKTWFDKILNACDLNDLMPAFSEFETYGTYCHVNYPGLYKPRYLNTFREGGYICGRHISEKKLRVMSFDLDIVSFEMSHAPMFPYNMQNIAFKYKTKWKNFRTLSLVEIIKKIKDRLKGNKSQRDKAVYDIIYRLPPR